jgi:hypothetical protein
MHAWNARPWQPPADTMLCHRFRLYLRSSSCQADVHSRHAKAEVLPSTSSDSSTLPRVCSILYSSHASLRLSFSAVVLVAGWRRRHRTSGPRPPQQHASGPATARHARGKPALWRTCRPVYYADSSANERECLASSPKVLPFMASWVSSPVYSIDLHKVHVFSSIDDFGPSRHGRRIGFSRRC